MKIHTPGNMEEKEIHEEPSKIQEEHFQMTVNIDEDINNGQNNEQNHHQIDDQENITHDQENGGENELNQQINIENITQNGGENELNQQINIDEQNDETVHQPEPVEITDEFDSFEDGKMVYRKYRLRDRSNKPVIIDYEPEPIHLPPSKIRYDHQDNFPCDKCSKVLDSRMGLLNHMRIHIANAKIKYTCAICQEQFDTNNLLITHKIVHKDCTFMCHKCQLAFTDHCDFLEHEISHTLRSSYKCAECGLYYNKTSYLIHINTHFDRKIRCDICSSLIQKYNMRYHMKDHNLKKCIECNKSIKPSNMTYHMSTHTGVKLFQCLYCGRGFANSNQRKVHTRIHTNERPYECDICNLKFKQSGDLTKHRITHFDGQFTCSICDKKFIHKESLKSHMSVHDGTQKFKCDICGQKISTQAGYKMHMLYKHSKEKKFKCDFCKMYFKTKVDLNRHNMQSLLHKRNMCKSKLKDEDKIK